MPRTISHREDGGHGTNSTEVQAQRRVRHQHGCTVRQAASCEVEGGVPAHASGCRRQMQVWFDATSSKGQEQVSASTTVAHSLLVVHKHGRTQQCACRCTDNAATSMAKQAISSVCSPDHQPHKQHQAAPHKLRRIVVSLRGCCSAGAGAGASAGRLNNRRSLCICSTCLNAIPSLLLNLLGLWLLVIFLVVHALGGGTAVCQEAACPIGGVKPTAAAAQE